MPTAQFRAQTKSAFCASEPCMSELPDAFQAAKSAWESKDKSGIKKACKALSEYLRCSFTPDNISGDLEDLFELDDDVFSDSVVIEAYDYSGPSLPRVTAIATLEIPTNGKLSSKKLDTWQEENEMLDSAVSFYWEFPDLELDDSSLSNHEGLGLVLTN